MESLSSERRSDAGRTAAHARQLVADHFAAICRRTDHLFALLMVLQWAAGIGAAIWLAPRADLVGLDRWTSVRLALIIGGVTSSVPLLLIWARPGASLTRHVVAVAQMIWSAILLHFTGARLETQFLIFSSLAILACYRDWRVLVTATLTVFAIDGLRGASVPGLLSDDDPKRTLERLGCIFFEVVFLWLAIRLTVRETWLSATSQARLAESNRRLDAEYRERTRNYRQYTERLERVQHDLKCQAEELRQARAAAEAADAAKSQLVATVSHEIRTPITAILGFADVLLGILSDAESIQAAKTIKRNSDFLLKLVDDLLDMSRIEAGKLTLERLACAPRQIASEVLQLLQVRADAKGLQLTVECDDDVPNSIVSDPFRLRQILLNLMSNAIKFSSHGEIQTKISIQRSDLSDPLVRFEVRDPGIGLTPRQIERLFHPFLQGEDSTPRLYGGSGLGLSISRRLANLLGGDIFVQSTPGRGSTFSFTVATGGPSTAEPHASSQTEDRSVEPVAFDAFRLSGRRVLVADDSPDNQELLSFVLRKSGASVTTVGDGGAAIAQALEAMHTQTPFDAIVLDVQMPVLDGFTAAERLRALGYQGPIVTLTAYARAEEMRQAQLSGCNACLTKPIDDNFLSQLAELVREQRQLALPAV